DRDGARRRDRRGPVRRGAAGAGHCAGGCADAPHDRHGDGVCAGSAPGQMIMWRARMQMPWACGIVAMGLCLASAYALEGDDARWPPFLPARNSVADATLV